MITPDPSAASERGQITPDGRRDVPVTQGEMRVCPNDGEPVIFTFHYPGHEYVCQVCGWLGGVLGTPFGEATPERVERYVVLVAQFNEAHGIKPERPLSATPVCGGCKAVAPTPHKPPHWFAKGSGSDTQYACSRGCIPSREVVMPW